MSEGSYLAVLVCTKHLAQGASGHFTVQTVDVDAFLFMLLTHGLVRFLFWPGRRQADKHPLISIRAEQ
jgi:hypothetical protein